MYAKQNLQNKMRAATMDTFPVIEFQVQSKQAMLKQLTAKQRSPLRKVTTNLMVNKESPSPQGRNASSLDRKSTINAS